MKYMSVPVSVLIFITANIYELLPLFSLTINVLAMKHREVAIEPLTMH